MRLLLVSGTDYSVIQFNDHIDEQSLSLEEVWDQVASDETTWIYDENDCYFEVQALTFGDVDLDFVQFLRDEIIDEDGAKHTDFFVVED